MAAVDVANQLPFQIDSAVIIIKGIYRAQDRPGATKCCCPQKDRISNCIKFRKNIMPNFAAIRHTVTEISRFFDIQDGGLYCIGLLKLRIFNG